MKRYLTTKHLFPALFIAAVTITVLSCEKGDGSPDMKAGNPQATALSPSEAPGGSVLTLTGTGLGQMRTIVFDKNNVPATFTPTLNTETSLVFRVPDTAFGGSQNIIFTNSEGNTLSVPFKVIALPSITSIFPVDFQQGTTVTIIGNNLDDVTKVLIEGTSDQATIVSKTRKQLVITMPSTTVNRAKLRITNSSGERLADNIELTYIPNAFKVFTDGFVDGMQDWSWCQTHDISSTVSFMGTQSLRGIFGAGAWGAISLHKNDPKLVVNNYQYLTFWIKGGTADTQFEVFSENGGSHKTITVPANVWTYFKLQVSTFMSGVNLERLDFQIHGPDGGAQTLYFDNILFVK